MIYCDTSFLLGLYVEVDPFHASARRAATYFDEPILLTLLLQLELQNGLRRSLAVGTISLQEHDAIFRQIVTDESQGLLVSRNPEQVDLFATARHLSKKFTPQFLTRSLDILHVAAALQLKASSFASFDKKQNALASAAELKLLSLRRK